MAPPQVSQGTPMGQRVMALAQTLQFAWFIGHITLIFCTLRYSLSYITFNYYSRWAQFSYRTAFVAAAATYGIVVYKAYRARARAGKGGQQAMTSLVADENVHYLAMSLIWLYSKQYPMALLPYTVYSIFHVATYVRANLLPVLQPAPEGSASGAKTSQSGIANSIGTFVKEYYDASMTIVALMEILLWFRLLGSAIIFAKGSWVLLALYTVFLRVRHSQNSFVQSAVSQATARIDGLVANQSTPPAVRNAYEQVKGGVRSAADATDVNRFARQQQAPKKAQ